MNTASPWCSREPVISVTKRNAGLSGLALCGWAFIHAQPALSAGMDYELGPDKQPAAVASPQPAPPASAWLRGPRNYLSRTVDRIAQAANHGAWEGYLPLHTHHLRFAYTQAKIDSYNENPLGLGFGRGVFDERGDWHGVYAMGFQDSHGKPEYQIGYGYKTYWPLYDEVKFGLGYTAFIGFRSDYHHYLPFPMVLPIFSLEYKKIALDTTYVPGGDGFGNVLFTWAKHSF